MRPSGTEPLIRVFAESKKEKSARELMEKGAEIVKSANC
ncbi:MAG: hypothetical protein ACE5KE_04160 [Methanosarcinales archaeon]